MSMFTGREILTITQGTYLGSEEMLNMLSVEITGVSTDTRSIKSGNLYIALAGEKYDGHAFCSQAKDKGASMLLVMSTCCVPAGIMAILVPDTLVALQKIARAYRDKLSCKVIAVTGSVGKTSTREMLSTAFCSSLRTHATKNNNNNEIGLSLTILAAPLDTKILIVEMGMRMHGEIRQLTQIARPDIAIITNIGVSHIERLGSREGILSAKMEICDGLSGEKTLLINGEDEYLAQYTAQPENKNWHRLGATCISEANCPTADFTVRARDMLTQKEQTSFQVYMSENGQEEYVGECIIPCVGVHHVKNALFAFLCAHELHVPYKDICMSMQTYVPTGSRGKIIQTPHYMIYDDTYNASPESFLSAFQSVSLLGEGKRKIAAVGGILELGEYAETLHFQVGVDAANSGMDMLLVCGDQRKCVLDGVHSVDEHIPVYLFENTTELMNELVLLLRPSDCVLVKASHAFEMEKVTQAIVGFDSRDVIGERL